MASSERFYSYSSDPYVWTDKFGLSPSQKLGGALNKVYGNPSGNVAAHHVIPTKVYTDNASFF